MSEADAFMTTAAAVSSHPDRALFVKIDSTLRGHVRATIEATLSSMTTKPDRVIVCPAFPALGRTVVEGVVRVDGIPIADGNLRSVFSGFAGSSGLFLPTVRSDEDLATLVRTMTTTNVLWVGSAGLARHVAEAMPPTARPTAAGTIASAPMTVTARRVAVVVGSQHQLTLEQLRALEPSTVVHRIDPRQTWDIDGLPAVLAGIDAIVLTGGHTARATLDALGIDRLDVCGEVEVGVPWSWATVGDRRVAVVTKAGGFGTALTLRHCVDFLSGRP